MLLPTVRGAFSLPTTVLSRTQTLYHKTTYTSLWEEMMAWVKRGHQRYYYRTRRVGGRFICQYIGKGAAAEQFLARERARRAEQQYDAVFDQAMRDLERMLRTMTRAALIARGYHRHGGYWRRKRDQS